MAVPEFPTTRQEKDHTSAINLVGTAVSARTNEELSTANCPPIRTHKARLNLLKAPSVYRSAQHHKSMRAHQPFAKRGRWRIRLLPPLSTRRSQPAPIFRHPWSRREPPGPDRRMTQAEMPYPARSPIPARCRHLRAIAPRRRVSAAIAATAFWLSCGRQGITHVWS